jgi:hypothetical protein
VIIQLTGPQWNVIANRIPAVWRDTMKPYRQQTYGRSHNYDLPAICWRRLLDHLTAQASGPLGGNTQGPEALYSAISTISRRVLEMEQHPALTNRAAVGWLPDVIPAFADPTYVRRGFSPYPFYVDGVHRFVLLAPRWITEREWKLTTWDSTNPDDLLVAQSVTYREEMQLVFDREFRPVGVDL